MRRMLLILAVVLACVTTAVATPQTGKTEVGGNFWFRYHLDRIDQSTQRSGFNVERGYIGLGYRWNPQVSGQMTINVFSSPDGLGLTGWDFELRDAYVNLKYFVPNGKMRIGLQKNYFGTVYDWKYLTARRSFADAVGVARERDYGVALMGMMPNGMGEWMLCAMNGEGFSSGVAPEYADKQPGIMANVRIVPMTETMVGFSLLRDKRRVFCWDYEDDQLAGMFGDGGSIGYETLTAFSFVGRIGSGPINILGEYLYCDYPIPDRQDDTKSINVKGTGFSVLPMMRLTEKLDLVGRYDSWDPDKDSEHPIGQVARWTETGEGGEILAQHFAYPTAWWIPDEYMPQYYHVKHDVYVAGLNYNITKRMEGQPGVIIQVNWQRMEPKEDLEWFDETDSGKISLDPVDSFIFQVKWGWGGLDF